MEQLKTEERLRAEQREHELKMEQSRTEEKLRAAILNIRKISKDKSIILINRTTRNKKDLASFFIKKKGKFHLLEDINGGPEIKKLILE